MTPDIDNPRFRRLADALLRRHDYGEAEANITSAVRDFLIETGLARADEIVEENPPSDESRRAVDLTALDTFIEVKRRIGNMQPGFSPDAEYVRQIDDYLALSAMEGKGVRTGILTDGRHWLLRWHGAGAVRTAPPYGFTLHDADGWLALYEWLRDTALVSLENIPPTHDNINRHLGVDSPSHRRDIDTLRRLYQDSAHYETIKVKRRLWYDLLRAALDDHHIADAHERETLKATISTIQRLHSEGRDHIWAYYTRNMVRPVALARSKVDVIIGNPPWINYNQTASVLRTELRRHSENTYGIWAGRQFATQQDVAGLFFARSVDLYLRGGGVIGMVLPHSTLRLGQHEKWRTGAWQSAQGTRTLSVNFGFKAAWDLYHLKPNNFFPMPASVVFAGYLGMAGEAIPLAGDVEIWQGATGTDDVQRKLATLTDTSEVVASPYESQVLNGATIFPRWLFFIEETENAALVRAGAGRTITVNPRRSSNDKSPWKDLDLAAITEQTIERTHVFDVHLGETVVPYLTLEPLRAALPLKHGDDELPADENGVGGIRLAGLDRSMRGRWETVSELWEENKSVGARNQNLLGQLDYYGKLSSQLAWRKHKDDKPVRIVYTKSGNPTAALLQDDDALVENVLYWLTCRDMSEAHYLLAIINSNALLEAAIPLMSKGQFGARDLHKHLWKLPIPEYDDANALHADISDAGKSAAEGVARELARVRGEREASGRVFSVTVARRELRGWLRGSGEGMRVEEVVGELLGR